MFVVTGSHRMGYGLGLTTTTQHFGLLYLSFLLTIKFVPCYFALLRMDLTMRK